MTSNVKRQIERNSSNFTAIGTSLRESTSFEPFCVKIGWGLASRGEPEKSQAVTRGSHDVSPLTRLALTAIAYRPIQTQDAPLLISGVVIQIM